MQWGGEGRPESFSSFWDGFTGHDNTGTDNEPGNQLAGFDFKFKLEPTPRVAGEFRTGKWSARMSLATCLPRICFLGGVEGHHGWGKDAVNWYVEAHDTRTNMRPNQLQLYRTTSIKMVITNKGIHWGMRWVGMVNSLPGRLELITEDNQRWSTRPRLRQS